jgi:peptide-methionine (S)-S-oxide reductase
MESIVLGGGCFWCLDAAYRRVKGVTTVTSGYAGGTWPNPSYERVTTGTTGHAEVVQIEFNEKLINLQTILEIFWTLHDPTTLNRQGNDIGTQYRSIILFDSAKQQSEIEKSIQKTAIPLWGNHITTEVVPLEKFYPAEDYHQDYFNKHPEQGYCQIIINPKLVKLTKKFAQLLKDEA